MSARELLNSSEGLHRHFLTIRCPDCGVRWLAPGVRHGETYVCKACGLGFVVREQKNQLPQPQPRRSRT